MADVTGVVIASGAIITATTLVRNATEKKVHLTPIVFGFLLTISMLGIAIFAPTFAKMLAYMGMVGAFAINGPAVFKLGQQLGK